MGFNQISSLILLIVVSTISLGSSSSIVHTSTNNYDEGISTLLTTTTTSTSSPPVTELDKKPISSSSTVKRQLKNNYYVARKPKFGFNFTMPGLTMNSIDTDTFLGPTGLFGGTNSDKTSSQNNMLGDIATIAAPILLLKGVTLAGLKAIKTLILPPIFFLVLLAFLIAGAAYFATQVFGQGGISNPFTGFTNAFSRNTYEFEQPIYNALDSTYQKYGQYYGNYNNNNYNNNDYLYNTDKSSISNAGMDQDFTTYQYQPYTTRYSSYSSLPKKDTVSSYKLRS